MDGETAPEPKKCPVCQKLGEICEKLGEGQFCNDLFGKLESQVINPDQFVSELLKNKKIADELQVKS
jgi:hypothetical protein